MKELGIKSLEEILSAAEEDFIHEDDDTACPPMISDQNDDEDAGAANSLMQRFEMTNTKHSRDMDRVFQAAMSMAEKLEDMGMNIDPAKAPRMFEVMGQHLKIAADASNSERDAQLKLMQIIQTQQKLDLEQKRLKHEMGDAGELKGEVIMVEDRNKLLAQLKAQKGETQP